MRRYKKDQEHICCLRGAGDSSMHDLCWPHWGMDRGSPPQGHAEQGFFVLTYPRWPAAPSASDIGLVTYP